MGQGEYDPATVTADSQHVTVVLRRCHMVLAAAGQRYGLVMDLSAWLLDAHADLQGRLFAAVVSAVPRDRWHEQADGGGSSVTWLLVHLARHHDLALHTAIRNKPPLFLLHRDALGLGTCDIGSALSEREDRSVSTAIAADPLLDYVNQVFAASRRWMQRVSAMAFDSIPDTARRLERQAGLDPAQLPWLFDMWSGRTVHWMVQWPILGHGQAHVGEAISIRNRMGLSPF
jgi:DinB superfamily